MAETKTETDPAPSVPALKSCPCCGWIAPLIANDHFCFADGPGWQLRCDKCQLQTCWWHSEAEAIAAWNARVVPQEQEAHQIMTPIEYAANPPAGWHEVCLNYDNVGNVAVRFKAAAPSQLAIQRAAEKIAQIWYRDSGQVPNPSRIAAIITEELGGVVVPEQPLCPVHKRLDQSGRLGVEIGNDCVACSLYERTKMLRLLAPFAPEDASQDSLTVLQAVIRAADKPQGDFRAGVAACVGVANEWVASPSCTAHDENPCCHVRTAAAIVDKMKALTESATPAITPEQQLLNVKAAFLESAEKECDELREALRNTAERELGDGSPCWCIDPPTRSAHKDYCEKARKLLAPYGSAPPDQLEGETERKNYQAMFTDSNVGDD